MYVYISTKHAPNRIALNLVQVLCYTHTHYALSAPCSGLLPRSLHPIRVCTFFRCYLLQVFPFSGFFFR